MYARDVVISLCFIRLVFSISSSHSIMTELGKEVLGEMLIANSSLNWASLKTAH